MSNKMLNNGNNNQINIKNNNKSLNNNSFNKTFNINHYATMKEQHKSVERPGLKDLEDNKEYKFCAYCLGRSQFKSKHDGYDLIIIVNLHQNNKYKSDHIHMHIKQGYYTRDLDNSIIIFNGIKETYIQDDEECYSVIMTKLLDYKKTFDISDDKFMEYLYSDEELEEEMEKYHKLLIDERRKILFTMLKNIDMIMYSTGVRDNFVSDFILSQFTFNKDYKLLSLKKQEDIQLSDKGLIQLILLCSRILYTIQNGFIYSYKDLFNEICRIVNVLQGVYGRFRKQDELPDLEDFCKTNDIPYGKKLRGKVNTRMNNYEYIVIETQRDIDDLYYMLWCEFLPYKDIFLD